MRSLCRYMYETIKTNRFEFKACGLSLSSLKFHIISTFVKTSSPLSRGSVISVMEKTNHIDEQQQQKQLIGKKSSKPFTNANLACNRFGT